jgi:hypothetical protein
MDNLDISDRDYIAAGLPGSFPMTEPVFTNNPRSELLNERKAEQVQDVIWSADPNEPAKWALV